jgi:hypothetical protein
MGNGYLWASMLKTSAFVGIGMFALMLILFVFVYHKYRKFGATLATVAMLVVGLVIGSCWLLYQGTLSNERVMLDRVDHRIMYIVDRQRRACILMDRVSAAIETGRERFEPMFRAARGYLRELEQPVVDVKDLDWLGARFRVGEAPSVSKPESLGYTFGGLLGFFIAAVTAVLASGYLVLRTYLEPETATYAGFLMTGAVLLGSVVFLSRSGEITPLVLTLLIPAAAAMLLHLCSRRESVTLLEIGSGVLLILSVGSYTLSSWAVVKAGEDEVRGKITLMNTKLPKVVQRAKSLGEALDRFAETGRYDEGWSARSACYDLGIEIGSLEEGLGNYDPQAKKPDELRDFDPYKAEFEIFLEDLRRGTR